MPSSKRDYRNIYRFQDRFLIWWTALNLPFYLTGGTALGRYYLRHRYSEDLDFFVNADSQFPNYLSFIRKEIAKSFHINMEISLITNDFARFYLEEEQADLKIEFVNEVDFRSGDPKKIYFGLIDTPLNILSNKLTALMSRDEPKDVFDMIHISLQYSFRWVDVFNDAKRKVLINEIDVEKRLVEFPAQAFQSVSVMDNDPDLSYYSVLLRQMSNDFLLGSANTLGIGKPSIEEAEPAFHP